jgi:SAM-dependent MidA family methyltransferase
MGSPNGMHVIELGPGRGTMMSDALRAAKVMPAFLEAAAIHLVEISPALEAQQERTLRHLTIPLNWHRALADVPKGPAIIVANEFFDALPVGQAVRTEQGWHERLIEIDSAGNLRFTIAPEPLPHFDRLLPLGLRNSHVGAIFEWRTDTVIMELGRRLARDGGAALVIDYGHAESATGDTLQAVGQHTYANPLCAPGSIDLTAHVDFEALAGAVEAAGAVGYGPITQSQFLRHLGILTRASALKAKAAPSAAAAIDAALKRLISEGEDGMGALFKAAAFVHASLDVPPGFED